MCTYTRVYTWTRVRPRVLSSYKTLKPPRNTFIVAPPPTTPLLLASGSHVNIACRFPTATILPIRVGDWLQRHCERINTHSFKRTHKAMERLLLGMYVYTCRDGSKAKLDSRFSAALQYCCWFRFVNNLSGTQGILCRQRQRLQPPLLFSQNRTAVHHLIRWSQLN